jgi:hypothetical protein
VNATDRQTRDRSGEGRADHRGAEGRRQQGFRVPNLPGATLHLDRNLERVGWTGVGAGTHEVKRVAAPSKEKKAA